MKKVKKSDLRTLIWDSYLHFAKGVPMLKTGKQPCNIIWVDVNSVCISVYDENEFDSEDDQKALMQNFAEHIDAITFGNLKVIDMGCDIESKFAWVHIANAYEVVE